MTHGDDARRKFGTDRAELVYGLNEAGQIVHISTVARGLACRCQCPSCGYVLVARTKDEHRVPHFAHHNRDACGGGPETALHLLAKELFKANPNLFLPPRSGLDKSGQIVMRPGHEVATTCLRMEYAGPHRIVPDLHVSVLGCDLFVEIAVTHPCDEVKIQRIKEHGVPAIEINLAGVPRDAPPDVIAEAVLRSAERRWLYHPGIDAANAKYRADEEARQADSEKRRNEALAKHGARAAGSAAAYRKALLELTKDSAEAPRRKELQAVGLDKHIGVEVAGFACFPCPPAVWQAIVLAEVFHDRCLGNQVRKAISITQHLEKAGLIRPHFRRVYRELAEDVTAIEPRFAPPWQAVDGYLKHLVRVGVLVQHGYGYSLTTSIADQWTARTLAEKKRTAAIHAVVQAVDWILGELPKGERGGMTGEFWLASVHAESGMTYRAAIQSDLEAPKIAAGIDAIVAMLERRGPPPLWTVGLPIEGAIDRRTRQMKDEAAKRKEESDREAKRLQQSRRDRLCVDAEQKLTGPALGAFLNTPDADLGGMSPLQAAEDSEAGLTKARRALAAVAAICRAEEVQEERVRVYRRQLREYAEKVLGKEEADRFLTRGNDEFGRLSPEIYCKDQKTLEFALGKVRGWASFVKTEPF